LVVSVREALVVSVREAQLEGVTSDAIDPLPPLWREDRDKVFVGVAQHECSSRRNFEGVCENLNPLCTGSN
jgi:hypothetical protein